MRATENTRPVTPSGGAGAASLHSRASFSAVRRPVLPASLLGLGPRAGLFWRRDIPLQGRRLFCGATVEAERVGDGSGLSHFAVFAPAERGGRLSCALVSGPKLPHHIVISALRHLTSHTLRLLHIDLLASGIGLRVARHHRWLYVSALLRKST